jgi:hypothetical protein
MKDQEIKSILQESWRTLSDVCEFHDDPKYSLDVEAVRELLKKIDAAAKALDLRAGRVITPQKSGGNRPGY